MIRPTNALMTVESFLIACPEFAKTDLQLIDSTLQETAQELDPTQWGNLLASAHKYKTAHALAISPMGNATRLVAGDGTTTYIKKFRELLLLVTIGGRVS